MCRSGALLVGVLRAPSTLSALGTPDALSALSALGTPGTLGMLSAALER